VGTFNITAIATDNTGASTTSAAVSIVAANGNPGNQPPRITLAINSHLVTPPATITLTGNGVSDPDTGGSITRVSFFMNGAKLTDLTAPPYTFNVQLNGAGRYTFYAEAQDNANGITQTLPQDVVASTAPTPTAVSADVWRLLNQATFGASQAEAAKVVALGGVQKWVDDQLQMPLGQGYPDTKYNHIQLTASYDCTNTDSLGVAFAATAPEAQCNRDHLTLAMLQRDFFNNAVTAADQLRWRVAWALSQITVTSGNQQNLGFAYVMSRYQNIMYRNAFGNYRQLLMDVTLSPAMADYLSMANNDRASGTRVPNENYAREIQQLFSVGLQRLNLDGTPIIDSTTGMPVPTYDQNTIKEFAKVFTGWTYADPNNPTATSTTAKRNPYYALPIITYPTTATSGHETSTKTLLPDSALCTVVPANQTPLQDINCAVDNVFSNPSTPPYISKILIQQLVTGDPSPAYVQRVSQVFVNDGTGTRGNLAAVVRAILLDPEARGTPANPNTAGVVREPVLFLTSLVRALSGVTDGVNLAGIAAGFGENPYFSPTVFNYYQFTNVVDGTNVGAPQQQILTPVTAPGRANTTFSWVYNGVNADTTVPNSTGTRLNITQFDALSATNIAGMVDQVDLVLTGGQTPAAAKQTIVNAITSVQGSLSNTQRSQMAVYLLASSYFYQVQH
ncbi:MAG TPA: DUF1800 family protein, partial [Vicinamibacterales bacterium]|nr:DUF1800 family protein [Vicinamibacterales bacterium]